MQKTGLFGQMATTFSLATILLVLLLHHCQPIESAQCPARKAYVPDLTTGFPLPSSQLQDKNDSIIGGVPEGTQLYWDWPSEFEEDCCSSGRIVNWTITTTEEYQYIARVNATCSNGEQISTPLYGFNNTLTCPNGTNSSDSVFQADDEGVFTYVSVSFMTGFMGFGNFSIDYIPTAVSCPAGTRPIGVGARSGCYALLELQVLCSKTNETQNNLDGVLDRNSEAQCSAYTSRASDTILVDPIDAEIIASDTYTDCCPRGEGIAEWTIAKSYTATGDYTGLIQGICTDNTVLAPVYYGYNGTGQYLCDQQRLLSSYHYNTPKSQQFYYSTNRVLGTNAANLLVSYMAPADDATDSRTGDVLTCPEGQGAVGYSAASSCYSLSNVSVLCGELSTSANQTLSTYGSTEANPPTFGEAGVCPGGISMIPNDTWALTIDAAYFVPDETSKLNPGPLYRSIASTSESVCCPSGQAITAFNVWPTDNVNYLVGKVSAMCSSYEDGRDPTNTSTIAYGYNGTALDGTASFCSNTTKDVKTIALVNGSWTTRSLYDIESIMEWPNRTADNAYGFVSNMTTASCPSDQQPTAFTARSSCWGLADFRVICGKVALEASLQPTSKTGLTAGGKAGIAVGVIVAVALASGFTFYKCHQRHKRRTQIESQRLFQLNGPAGFHSGVTTLDKGSISSAADSRGSSRFLSTQLMTIENIDCSNDATPVSFEGIPPEWEIKKDQIRLHCVDGKPIELGRGGFGVVLFGTVHKENAAIKLIKGRGKEDELLREVAILERAKTQYVVRFLGYSVCPDGILLAMEYMQGGTLWDALRDNDEFQWYNRGEQAFKDICKGLYMLHNNRIAHLDMKTPNILIANDCTCKISDLGLGKLLKTEANTCTADAMGSFAWMGPERINGRCGFSSDIWALSTIIWEICTLQIPDREASASDIQVPEQAPQAVVDLMIACRQEHPNDRPLIGTICDLLDSWEYGSPALPRHVSVNM